MQLISGPGVGLPLPQNLYPTELYNAPYDFSNNQFDLSAGDALVIPSGRYFVGFGLLGLLQFQDPITQIWRGISSARVQNEVVYGDGFTRRIANLTGCPVAAIVANGGTGFAASTATITATVGGSTWVPIVGGSLSVSTINNAGANYDIAPLLFIPAPPAPGVQATGYCTLTSGTVSAVSLDNFGAGYTAATVAAVILPNPTDPNFGSITQATVTIILNAANAAKITAALCTNNGAPLATLTALTLTAAGGSGSGATITPLVMQTVTSATVVAGGVGMGSVSNPALVMSAGGGGNVSTSAIVNPAIELTGFIPRPFLGYGTANAGGTISAVTIQDSGLFLQAPSAVVVPGAGGQSYTSLAVVASIGLNMGSKQETILMQPL